MTEEQINNLKSIAASFLCTQKLVAQNIEKLQEFDMMGDVYVLKKDVRDAFTIKDSDDIAGWMDAAKDAVEDMVTK